MRSLYVAASGMAAQQTRIDTVANNVANVGTTGFKRQRSAFEDVAYQQVAVKSRDAEGGVAELGGGVRVADVERDLANGAFEETGNPLHMAINGPAWLAVETPDGGMAYTRDGALGRSADGTLVTATGMPLAGGIVVPPDATNLTIEPDGTVSASFGNDAEPVTLGRLELAVFPNPARLSPKGGNLFAETPSSGVPRIAEPEDGVVQQGFLERSNVDIASELIELILAQRAFELNSKVVQAADETLQTAANLRR